MSSSTSSTTDTGKKYHNTTNGEALKTVKEHQGPADLTLFAGCFCPFVQRVWIALEYLEIDYQYCMRSLRNEVDPYKKPDDLVAVSPKGLIPAIKLNNTNPPRALCENARYLLRHQTYHINRSVIPSFYRYLQAQNSNDQIENGKSFLESIIQLIKMFESSEDVLRDADSPGLWGSLGTSQPQTLNWADVMVAPWLFRATNVLKHYRGFQFPPSTKFQEYLDRLLNHPCVKRTCSDLDLYLDSYERYAFNRPNTSQVANAINSGKELP
ncbi:hypothetical protein Clacol_004316 [Clathrus columnatus]|uniref:GST N-terminal domain-containing protein n=1 Tax=Clathrus columnatus TaxID=1419009 RepID=A0AAV5ADT9_9AGAM|nr:hypothetical protein Clacol_004316 [Clathrus columnatus]